MTVKQMQWLLFSSFVALFHLTMEVAWKMF